VTVARRKENVMPDDKPAVPRYRFPTSHRNDVHNGHIDGHRVAAWLRDGKMGSKGVDDGLEDLARHGALLNHRRKENAP